MIRILRCTLRPQSNYSDSGPYMTDPLKKSSDGGPLPPEPVERGPRLGLLESRSPCLEGDRFKVSIGEITVLVVMKTVATALFIL